MGSLEPCVVVVVIVVGVERSSVVAAELPIMLEATRNWLEEMDVNDGLNDVVALETSVTSSRTFEVEASVVVLAG